MNRQETFERIVASLHEAAFDDAHWPATSGLIDEVCRLKGNCLIFGDQSSRGDVEILFTRTCYRGQRHIEVEQEYFGVYHLLDERVPRVRLLPDGQLVRAVDLFSERERKTSLVYNELLPRTDYQNSLTVRLDGPEGSRIVWTFADPVDGCWSSDQILAIERLLPHLRHFIRVRHALVDAQALGTSLTDLLDNTRAGVIYLDRRGRITDASNRARDILRRSDGLSDENGALCASTPEDHAELQRLLARALPPFGGQGEGGTMIVNRTFESARLVLHMSPVEDREVEFRSRRVAALVLIVDPRRRERIDRSLVAATLGLTRTESEVAALLAGGMTPGDIAVATGRRESTVRWHLKHIFNKLGVSRQIEVAQLVLPLAGLPWSRS